MSKRRDMVLRALAPVFVLTACTTPEVRESRLPTRHLPLVATLVNPSRLEPATREFLRSENLLDLYRRNPEEAIRTLQMQPPELRSLDQRRVLVELCANTGESLARHSPMRAVGYYLAAADLALPGALTRGGSDTRGELKEAYNFSCGRVARLLFDAGHDWTRPVSIDGPVCIYRLSCRTSGIGAIDPGRFDQLWAADFLRFKGIDLDRHHRPGYGAALVGHRAWREERTPHEPFLPPFGMARPACATLDFGGKYREVELIFHDVMTVERARLAGRSVNLQADLTAPLALLHNFFPRHNVGLAGMLYPLRYRDRAGLFQLEPFRPDRVPVVLVHGLMSSPASWITTINMLREDPELRRRYQVLTFYYPTGFPVTYNAASLRDSLGRFQEFYDSERRNPRMRQMVLAGHSMGGILSNAQIRRSGGVLETIYFGRRLDEVPLLSDAQHEMIERLLVYEANPDVTRAIFIAVPHRGSAFAANPLGRFGAGRIRLPFTGPKTGLIGSVEGLTAAGTLSLNRPPNSIRSLRPDMPLLSALLDQPVNRLTKYHSLMARRGDRAPVEESGDGLVAYRSAHLDGAASEKVFLAGHSEILRKPEAVEELRRILYLHAGLSYPRPPASARRD